LSVRSWTRENRSWERAASHENATRSANTVGVELQMQTDADRERVIEGIGERS
jgi:hypothetical protein